MLPAEPAQACGASDAGEKACVNHVQPEHDTIFETAGGSFVGAVGMPRAAPTGDAAHALADGARSRGAALDAAPIRRSCSPARCG